MNLKQNQNLQYSHKTLQHKHKLKTESQNLQHEHKTLQVWRSFVLVLWILWFCFKFVFVFVL